MATNKYLTHRATPISKISLIDFQSYLHVIRFNVDLENVRDVFSQPEIFIGTFVNLQNDQR